jgi:hypothetical protein
MKAFIRTERPYCVGKSDLFETVPEVGKAFPFSPAVLNPWIIGGKSVHILQNVV